MRGESIRTQKQGTHSWRQRAQSGGYLGHRAIQKNGLEGGNRYAHLADVEERLCSEGAVDIEVDSHERGIDLFRKDDNVGSQKGCLFGTWRREEEAHVTQGVAWEGNNLNSREDFGLLIHVDLRTFAGHGSCCGCAHQR
jgi:hypothetical protein